MQKNLEQFTNRGVVLMAISVDTPEDSRRHCEKQGYTYTFLSDSNAEVIRRYGVLHAKSGMGGKDVARPAEFLIDAGGIVRWVNFTEDYRVRARAGQMLKALGDPPPPGG